MKFLALIFLFGFLFFGCGNQQSDYITLQRNSGLYKLITHGDGIAAEENQYILYSLFFVDDQGTVFLDKRVEDHLLREQIKKDSFSLENISPVSELLQILSKGDSAILKIPLKKEEKVKDLANSDTLIFYLKVIDIMDEKQVLDYLSQQFVDKQKENSKVSNEYSEAKNMLINALKGYKRGNPDGSMVNTMNGIEYIVLKKGEGAKIRKGQKARFDYIGLTANDEKEFGNSYSKPEDVEITLGAKQEITGWDEAVSVMNKNMVAIFFMPSNLAYGEKGKKGVVPAGADLIYLIELHDILN